MGMPISDWHGDLHPDLKGQLKVQGQLHLEESHHQVSYPSKLDNTI